MSDVFFRDLGLPPPDVDLGVGSGSHAAPDRGADGRARAGLRRDRPSLVVVYGDVNSTLAAALVAAKLGLPAGPRGGRPAQLRPTMPEEINRRVTDILSDLLFVTSPEGVDNLVREGVDRRGASTSSATR